MDSKQALDFINSLLVKNGKEVLNELETNLFLGCWEGKTYDEITIQAHVSEQYLRAIGIQLFRKIKQELGIKVSKKNFRNPIKYKYQEYQSQLATISVIERFETDDSSQAPNNHASIADVTANSFSINKNINNPFIPTSGKISDPQLFWGREREIQSVFEILNSGSCAVLVGEEGVGKSSLLAILCQQANHYFREPRQQVFIDLNEIDNDEDFYLEFCHEVGIGESTGQRLTRNLRRHENKILLALDNVGKMTSPGFTRNLRDKLRSLSEGGEPLKLILAANQPLNKLFADSPTQGSPLAGICIEQAVLPWDETIIRQLVRHRLQGTSIHFRDAEIQEIITTSRGYPRVLMQMCHKLFAQYRDSSPSLPQG